MLAGTLGGLLDHLGDLRPLLPVDLPRRAFVERLRGNRALSAALAAITAAVVGVILNLAIWFALHSLFRADGRVAAGPLAFDAPVPASVNLPALILTAAAIVAIFRFKLGAMPVLAACALAGVGYWLFLG